MPDNSRFMEEITAWTRKTKARLRLVPEQVVLTVASSLIDKSPVGDPALWESKPGKHYVPGTFKANWNGSSGEIDTSTQDETDPTGELSFVRIAGAIPSDLTQAIFYISNSLPYAQALEDGHSTQAPTGMVGLTVLEFDQIFAASIVKAKALAS